MSHGEAYVGHSLYLIFFFFHLGKYYLTLQQKYNYDKVETRSSRAVAINLTVNL